mgnify:CR=1 FL=1
MYNPLSFQKVTLLAEHLENNFWKCSRNVPFSIYCKQTSFKFMCINTFSKDQVHKNAISHYIWNSTSRDTRKINSHLNLTSKIWTFSICVSAIFFVICSYQCMKAIKPMHTQRISIFQEMGFMAKVELTCYGHLETTTQILGMLHYDIRRWRCVVITIYLMTQIAWVNTPLSNIIC